MNINSNYSKMRWTVILLSSIFMFSLAWKNYSIWIDEWFTMNVIGQNIHGAIQTIIQDGVHPPLYYLLLYIFEKIITVAGIDSVPGAKVFSILWIIIALIQGSTMIQKRFSNKASLIFLVLCSGTEIIGYSVEIRMYSMAMYMTLITYLYGSDLLKDIHDDHSRILFVLYSIFAVWTHYFCTVYLSILWFAILYKDIKEHQIKKWFLSFIVTALSFLPWIILISGHSFAREVSSFPSFLDLCNFVVYPFYVHNVPLTILLFVITVSISLLVLIKNQNHIFITVCLLSPVYVFLVGLILSTVTGKFFTGKYLLPGWMAVYAGLAVGISNLKSRKKITIIFTLLNLLSWISIGNFENKDRNGWFKILSYEHNQEGYTLHADGDIARMITIAEGNSASFEPDYNDVPHSYYLLNGSYITNQVQSSWKKIDSLQFGGSTFIVFQRD